MELSTVTSERQISEIHQHLGACADWSQDSNYFRSWYEEDVAWLLEQLNAETEIAVVASQALMLQQREGDKLLEQLDTQQKSKQHMFPLQQYGGGSIPWEVAEIAYREYARRYGTSQSMERLAQRSGFSIGEMDMFYPDWRDAVDIFKRQQAHIEVPEQQLDEQQEIRAHQVRHAYNWQQRYNEAFSRIQVLEEALREIEPYLETLGTHHHAWSQVSRARQALAGEQQ